MQRLTGEWEYYFLGDSMVQFNQAIQDKLNTLGLTHLKGHYIFDNGVSEFYLKSRYEADEKIEHNISYEVTNDQDLVKQYFKIREEAYKDSYNFCPKEDFFDKVSDFIIAKSGSVAIGGIRITISSPENRIPIPIESCVDFEREFPEIDFSKITYGEATRLAVLPSYRNGEVSGKIQKMCVENSLGKMNVDLCFGCGPATQTRRLEIMFRRMGYKFVVRTNHLVVPGFEGEYSLWIADFTPNAEFVDRLQPKAEKPAHEDAFQDMVFA